MVFRVQSLISSCLVESCSSMWVATHILTGGYRMSKVSLSLLHLKSWHRVEFYKCVILISYLVLIGYECKNDSRKKSGWRSSEWENSSQADQVRQGEKVLILDQGIEVMVVPPDMHKDKCRGSLLTLAWAMTTHQIKMWGLGWILLRVLWNLSLGIL